MLEQLVDVGRVGRQPDDVAEGHVGPGQDGLQVVEGELELLRHVVGVLRVAIRVDRVLTAADELAPVTFDQLRLVESKLVRPGPGID